MGLSDLRPVGGGPEKGPVRVTYLFFPSGACGGYVCERRWGVGPARAPRAVKVCISLLACSVGLSAIITCGTLDMVN